MVSKQVILCEEYTPKDMEYKLILHKTLNGVLQSKLESCKRSDAYLDERSYGEFLVNTLDAKVINSEIWEQEEDLRMGREHCFKLFIKMELSEESRENAKKL